MTSLNPELTTCKALRSWLLDFHASTATLNAHLVADNFFTSDIHLQYANNPTAIGRKTVQEFFNTAFNALDSMHHDIVYFDFVAPDKLYQAAKIEYVVKGDDRASQMITVPAMMTAWLREEDGGLKMWRTEIFLDASGVFGRMAEKGLL